jgi:hypothetical protein
VNLGQVVEELGRGQGTLSSMERQFDCNHLDEVKQFGRERLREHILLSLLPSQYAGEEEKGAVTKEGEVEGGEKLPK